MLRRASDYPSYIVQLELCGQDGEWLLEDFEQRLDSRAISGDYRLMFMRILSTGRGFHEGSFRTKLTEEGQESLVYLCDGKSPDTFRRFVEQDAYGTID